jgi:hypothetical protein
MFIIIFSSFTMFETILKEKARYKSKVEHSFHTGDSRACWKGVETITGYKPKRNSPPAENAKETANELNVFYTRFDKHDFTAQQQRCLQEMQVMSSNPVMVNVWEVKKQFQRIKTRSAAGPDNICGRLLKECHQVLAPVYTRLFQQSLDSGVIPRLWKTSTIVPVAKKPSPQVLNDYRPVALTSIPFKCLERIVLSRLKEATDLHQDAYQFAYREKRGTDDAIITLLHYLTQHLDKPRSYARVLYIDFSSAFNTIQPHLMMQKLLAMDVNPTLIKWIFGFLAERPQAVRIGSVLSDLRTTNTGAPQGCVLSPALFTLYTADCKATEDNTLLVKFADDTSLSGLLQEDESQYRSAVDSLVEWCDRNYLDLNVGKTKEMVIDFRLIKDPIEPVIIKGEPVEIVRTYRYLGTTIDDKLSWTDNILERCELSRNKLYFLRRLRQFNVDQEIMSLFYRAVIQTSMSFNIVSYFGNAFKKDTDLLDRIVSDAARISGRDQANLEELYNAAVLRKVSKILANASHPLRDILMNQKSKRGTSRRFRSLPASTERSLKSFLPTAIRRLNSNIR